MDNAKRPRLRFAVPVRPVRWGADRRGSGDFMGYSSGAARLVLGAALAFLAGLGLAGAPARAQIGSDRYAAIVVEPRSGTVLVAANADEPRYPASLTKMMTLYMVFEALRDGSLSLSTPIAISASAAAQPPSKLGLPPGSRITAENAIYALVTKSANDVASAVGEHLGDGSESRFAQMMTLRARALGMSRTTFRNASGLPDPDQSTTARDMAILGQRLLRDFPDRYHYFGTQVAQLGRLRLRNHNRMLESYEGVDGIKTGFIRDSGFNIVTSAQRGGVRLVGAVFGGQSWTERDMHMATLLDQGFERMGVAPRAPLIAARPAPTLVRTASAATTRSAAATSASRTRSSASRPAASASSRTARSASARRATPARSPASSAASRSRTQSRQGEASRSAASARATPSQPRKASAAGTARSSAPAQQRRSSTGTAPQRRQPAAATGTTAQRARQQPQQQQRRG